MSKELRKAEWRTKLVHIFESPAMHAIVGTLIILNMIGLGLETSAEIMETFGKVIDQFNTLVLVIFAIEILSRLIGHGFSFFRDPWHVFDFLIVGTAIFTVGGFIQIFRVLRVIWLLRLLTMAPQFQHLIDSIIRAIPKLLTVAFLLLLTIYVFAVIGTLEFGATVPDKFGTLQASAATISQTMLMPHLWSELLEQVRDSHPWGWIYIIPLMIFLNYMLLHLVVGVIIAALQQQFGHEQEESKKDLLNSFRANKNKAPEGKTLSADQQFMVHEFDKLKEYLNAVLKSSSSSKKT